MRVHTVEGTYFCHQFFYQNFIQLGNYRSRSIKCETRTVHCVGRYDSCAKLNVRVCFGYFSKVLETFRAPRHESNYFLTILRFMGYVKNKSVFIRANAKDLIL